MFAGIERRTRAANARLSSTRLEASLLDARRGNAVETRRCRACAEETRRPPAQKASSTPCEGFARYSVEEASEPHRCLVRRQDGWTGDGWTPRCEFWTRGAART
mmetsp:Transcript_43/g.112  ORF Transcript_43/g.112 Transcript_43/m.112 type:complete len:104 (+) Transcript_43:450-761(+)